MNEQTLNSATHQLGHLFSKKSSKHFFIPSYQRPYAWTQNETQQLFDDLFDAFNSAESGKEYFLGMLVLVKDSRDPHDSLRHDIVDGQQRLITLTILFSILYSKAENEMRKSCNDRLWDEGDPAMGVQSSPLLTLRDVDQQFFQHYIQEFRVDELRQTQERNESVEISTDSQKHIVENAILLLRLVEEKFGDNSKRLTSFIEFVCQKCSVIAAVTNDTDSAIRIFSVMNSRGLDLQFSDIFKAELLEKIKDSKEREKYARKWEENIEEEIDRSNLDAFLSQICTILHPYTKNETVLDLLRTKLLKGRTPQSVIDETLIPYAKAYRRITGCDYESLSSAEEVNGILYCLNLNINVDWIPLAMKGYVRYKSNPNNLLEFLRKLDLLAAYLNATGKYSGARLQRYQQTLKDMLEDNPPKPLKEIVSSMELTPTEEDEFCEALNSEIYKMTKDRRKTLLLRIDALLSEGVATYNTKKVTIEHVLPQNPGQNSSWRKDWNEEDQERWVHRLGNLVLLSQSKNSAASNYDFKEKTVKYFNTKKKGATPFCLTMRVLNEEKWTPETVERRQRELIDEICRKWGVKRTATPLVDENDVFYFDKGNSHAKGRYVATNSNKGFVVFKGSTISFPTKADDRIVKEREKLLNQGIINGDIFVQDYTFTSASSAAKFIAGYSLSGPANWKTTTGKLLKELVEHEDE